MTVEIAPDEARLAWLAAEFERHRGHLRGVGYRMLGSVTEADDAVQEAWLRLARSDPGGTDGLRGWLTVTVGRICLDVLRARRARRESYAGTWLPEPIVTAPAGDTRSEPGPEGDAVLADSVGLALLVVLETLNPSERLAFVLHDMFGIPFEEIAPLVDRSPAATRQLASRARRRVQGATPNVDSDLATQRTVVEAFLAASRSADFDGLIAVLDPHAVFRIDVGPDGARARAPIEGAEAVAQQVLARGSQLAHLARPAIVNGAAGVIVGKPGRPFAVVGFTVAGGRILEIDLITDPRKLTHLSAQD